MGKNRAEISDTPGPRIFFSYAAPCAAYDPTREGNRWVKTNNPWGNTTERHIREWLNGIEADPVDPSYFDHQFGLMVRGWDSPDKKWGHLERRG